MAKNGKKKLSDAISAAEKLEQDLEKQVKSLKQQKKELQTPDAISRAFKPSGTAPPGSKAPHLAD